MMLAGVVQQYVNAAETIVYEDAGATLPAPKSARVDGYKTTEGQMEFYGPDGADPDWRYDVYRNGQRVRQSVTGPYYWFNDAVAGETQYIAVVTVDPNTGAYSLPLVVRANLFQNSHDYAVKSSWEAVFLRPCIVITQPGPFVTGWTVGVSTGVTVASTINGTIYSDTTDADGNFVLAVNDTSADGDNVSASLTVSGDTYTTAFEYLGYPTDQYATLPALNSLRLDAYTDTAGALFIGYPATHQSQWRFDVYVDGVLVQDDFNGAYVGGIAPSSSGATITVLVSVVDPTAGTFSLPFVISGVMVAGESLHGSVGSWDDL